MHREESLFSRSSLIWLGGVLLIITSLILVIQRPFMAVGSQDSEWVVDSQDGLSAGDPRTLVYYAASAILVDVDTVEELYTYHPERSLPPASLAKLVTAYVVLEAVEDGEIDLHGRQPIPEAAWAKNQPPNSSLMFLGPDQEVSIDELLLGLIVASGNDAAIALALRVTGSVNTFVTRMNQTVDQLGYDDLHFADPAGLSSENRITARQFTSFLINYMKRWPWVLERYHNVPRIIYPREENLKPGMKPQGVILYSQNNLLSRYSGTDGLKTGHLEVAGYHIAATAKRGNTRLLALVLGVDAPNSQRGTHLREEEAMRLLDYGFELKGISESSSIQDSRVLVKRKAD